MVVLTRLGPPEAGIRHTQPLTTVYVNERPLGVGVIYISEARVSWVGEAGQGFSLEYPHISLHAVSKDLSQFPAECLYLIIDVRLVESEGTPNSTPNDSDDDAQSDQGMTEIRFVPEDKTSLDPMFKAMAECQTLHPDPDDVSDGDDDLAVEEEEAEDDEGVYDDADEEEDNNGVPEVPMEQ
eukprot:snap_masked-scaffold122_size333723-processed-gene-2.15 protein:Tk04118 transcript:snap_masked-scaffold122_size333723-processed-gene-2.15-mRNA-1 annotation:"methylosome subunit picln"